ncbi:MAG: hypothetical protein PQ964_07935 [Methanobacteriaceae archaeon]|jgi:hypothetical protein
MDRRGIITTDLIFASFLILVIISSTISVVSERIDIASNFEMYGRARMITEYVAGAINKVYTGGNGHAVTLSLPANISGESYVIRVNSSGVYISFAIGGVRRRHGKSFISHNKIWGTTRMYGNRSYIIRNVRGHDGSRWVSISTI